MGPSAFSNQIKYVIKGLKDIKKLYYIYGTLLLTHLVAILFLAFAGLVVVALFAGVKAAMAIVASFITDPKIFFFLIIHGAFQHPLMFAFLFLFVILFLLYIHSWVRLACINEALSFAKTGAFEHPLKELKRAFRSGKVKYGFFSLVFWMGLSLLLVLVGIYFQPLFFYEIWSFVWFIYGILSITIMPGAFRANSLKEAILNPIRLLKHHKKYALLSGILVYIVFSFANAAVVLITAITTIASIFIIKHHSILVPLFLLPVLLLLFFPPAFHLSSTLEAFLLNAPLPGDKKEDKKG